MANKILVFIEQRDNLIKKSSLEAANLAAELAKNHGGDLEAVIIGNEVEEVKKPGEMGVKKILHFKSPDLQHYSPTAYRDIVAEYAKESGANILIFSNTALGKDLAPRVAVKLNAGIAVDCISFKQDGDDIVTSRPVYGG